MANNKKQKQSRRRDLKRSYVETFVSPGVLAITCQVNKKVWIYSTYSVRERLNRYRYELIVGVHKLCPDLQKDAKEYGCNKFTFEVLEEIEKSDEARFDYDKAIDDREQKWLELYIEKGVDLY